MAKKKKSVQTNVVKKNAWSVVSIWWGILVFGLLIPALFIATCLDINSYKKAVWAHVENEKTTVADAKEDVLDKLDYANGEVSRLQAAISQSDANIAAIDGEIAALEAEIADLDLSYLDELSNLLMSYSAKSSSRLTAAEIDQLFVKNDAYSTVSQYVLTAITDEINTVSDTAFVNSYVDPESSTLSAFNAQERLAALKNVYANNVVKNDVLKGVFNSALSVKLTDYSTYTPDEMKPNLYWTSYDLETALNSDETYVALNALTTSVEAMITAMETLNDQYDTQLSNLNEALGAVKSSGSSYIDEIQDDVDNLPDSADSLLAGTTVPETKITELKNFLEELNGIKAQYKLRFEIEKERELYYGIYVDVTNPDLDVRYEDREEITIADYMKDLKASADPYFNALGAKLEQELDVYGQAYYDYRAGATEGLVYEGLDEILEAYRLAYANNVAITEYANALTAVKNNTLPGLYGSNNVFVKILHGIDVANMLNKIETEQNNAILTGYFDEVRSNINSVNQSLKNGAFDVAVYNYSNFYNDFMSMSENGGKVSFKAKLIADIESEIAAQQELKDDELMKKQGYQASIDSNNNTIAEYTAYKNNIERLESTIENLLANKKAKEYDSNKNTKVAIGPSLKDYTLAYKGTGAFLGLTCGGGMLNLGLVQKMLNKNNSLNKYELIASICLIIAVAILVLVYTIQIIRIIIAKKTAWIFHDGAVVYRKGRIFYTEEYTRDMEFFPGMSVSVRHTIKGKIFKYGDVVISNGAGEAGEIVMHGVRNPKKVHEMISQMLVACCTRTANMMSPYKMYPQMYRHVLGGYPAYYYGAMQMNGINNPNNGGK